VKILVVDDSRVMRQIIIRTLRQAGYDGHDIMEAEDGRDAVAKAEAEQPGLVLCDWHMPDMTGMQCLQALRAAGCAVPFGFITSDAAPELRRQAAEAGALFVLGKPFTEESLRKALEGQVEPTDGDHGPDGGSPQRGEGGETCPRTGSGGDLLPAPKDVRDMFAGLLGRPVTVRPGARVQPTAEKPVSLAVYVDPQRSINAVCLMDLPLSAYTAGALALLPAGGVRDAVEEGALSPTLAETLREVVNVLSGVVNTPGAPHSELDRLYVAGAYLPEELLVMASGFERLDLTIDVPGYGGGSLSLVRTA
jgi:CheY-like chemotaxis protein